MGNYKVIQDIEAEDKLFGPFSLRQFIYLIIVIGLLFLGYKLLAVAWFLVFLILPFIIFFGLLAAPFGQDQSSEVWLLAKIRFALKPRVRIWDQTGAKELVTITAPKVIEKNLTKNLSQIEVKSRLQALAHTIDSRGWAVKNVDVNIFSQPNLAIAGGGSDRLVTPGLVSAPTNDVQASDDMFEASNTTTQYIDQMMHSSSQTHRQQIVDQMKQSTQAQPSQPAGQGPQADYWFLNNNAGSPVSNTSSSTPPPRPEPMSPQGSSSQATPSPVAQQPLATQQNVTAADEQALLAKLHANEGTRPSNVWNHLKTIKPIDQQQAEATTHPTQAPPPAPEPPMTPAPDPAILGLANNDDLNVATIAHEANKAKDKKPPDDEVVISLH